MVVGHLLHLLDKNSHLEYNDVITDTGGVTGCHGVFSGVMCDDVTV